MEGISEREDLDVVLEMFWLHESEAVKKLVETNTKNWKSVSPRRKRLEN